MEVPGEESDGERGDDADDEGAAEWGIHALNNFLRNVDVAELWTVYYVAMFSCLMLSYCFIIGCIYVLSVCN